MNDEAIVLKTDNRGRVRTPPEGRAALVTEFGRSGLPAAKFSALVSSNPELSPCQSQLK